MQPHQCLRFQPEAGTTPITVLLFGVGRRFLGPMMMMMMTMMIVVIVMGTTKKRKSSQPSRKMAMTTYGDVTQQLR